MEVGIEKVLCEEWGLWLLNHSCKGIDIFRKLANLYCDPVCVSGFNNKNCNWPRVLTCQCALVSL